MTSPLLAEPLAYLSYCRERLEDAEWWISRVRKEDIGDLEKIELAAIESRMREIMEEIERLK